MAATICWAMPAQAQLSEDDYKRMLKQAQERIKSMEDGMLSPSTQAGPQFTSASARHDRIVKTEIVKTEQLKKGEETKITIRLFYEDDGTPVTPDRLQVIHTKPLHLLIVEPQLNDYHHIHPIPGETPGEYVFTMTPETDCHYRVWADMYPVDGEEQNTWTDIKGQKHCAAEIEETTNMSASHNGYQYMLSMDTEELAYDQDTMIYIDVMDEDGKAVSDLQPVMGAFAHLVGFFTDYETIAHIHPMGREPVLETERGGPTLEFHVRPEKPGYIRFYLQTLIDDEMQFVPFGMMIAEEGPYTGQARMAEMMGMGGMQMQGMSGMSGMDHSMMEGDGAAAPAGLSESQKAQFRKIIEETGADIPESVRRMIAE